MRRLRRVNTRADEIHGEEVQSFTIDHEGKKIISASAESITLIY